MKFEIDEEQNKHDKHFWKNLLQWNFIVIAFFVLLSFSYYQRLNIGSVAWMLVGSWFGVVVWQSTNMTDLFNKK